MTSACISTSWGYSAYDDVTRKLTARGIPSQEIAVIGDADSDAKKKVLFDKVRAGQVRVLLGSTTQKMGTGTNVQKRLVALHHLDARPGNPPKLNSARAASSARAMRMRKWRSIAMSLTGSFDSPTCGRHWKQKQNSSTRS